MVSDNKSRGPADSAAKTRGFTLIEVLIALALLSVLLVALYETLFPVFTAREKIETELERTREIRRFLDIFSIEVRSSFYDETDTENTFFLGSKGDSKGRSVSNLSFTSFTYPVLRKGLHTGAVQTISYFVVEGPEGRLTLFKSISNPYLGEAAGFSAEVVENIESFEVLYYNGEDWSMAWDTGSDRAPPRAVKAVVRVKDRGELSEFSTIARPRTG